MPNAIVPNKSGSLQMDGQGAGMTSCRVVGIALGALVLGIVLSQIPDIIRYIRISNM
ncbi:MAG TPA: hypothetical protein VME41_14665 [Stellaceae bacterium]|nr:hypothetical protein [Stellaceae bacterium]